MYSCLLRTGIILCWRVWLVCMFNGLLKLLCLACHVCLLKIEIIFVRIEIIVLIFAQLLVFF
jgi:hypothetical protein